jgi:hypothetical protein
LPEPALAGSGLKEIEDKIQAIPLIYFERFVLNFERIGEDILRIALS